MLRLPLLLPLLLISCATTPSTPPAPSLPRRPAPADLSLSIQSIQPTPTGFPNVTALLTNQSNDSLQLDLSPNSFTLHVGAYQQSYPQGQIGMGLILHPHTSQSIPPTPGNWRKISPTGQPELLLPTSLPDDSYDLYLTFKPRPSTTQPLSSPHQPYQYP